MVTLVAKCKGDTLQDGQFIKGKFPGRGLAPPNATNCNEHSPAHHQVNSSVMPLRLQCKVALMGDAAVGKTSLSSMFVSKGTLFPKNYKLTSGVDVLRGVCAVPSDGPSSKAPTTVDFYVHDVGGQDVFRDLAFEATANAWAKDINYVLLVYDVTVKASFDNIAKHYATLKNAREEKDRPLHAVLVANKSDLSAHANTDLATAKEWAGSHNMDFVEVSTLPPGSNINKPFELIAQKFYTAYQDRMLAVSEMV